ncbi:MAG TPA: hypothetical protein VK966_00725 [Longimicrobiales bacterium]|nr:hypothetical protein [Longimicrobiales bacterium]
MSRSAAVLLIPLLAIACGDSPDVDFNGEDGAEDLFVVHSDDGAVKMALTEEHVYFALSDSVLTEAQRDLEADDSSEGGIGRVVGGAVRGTVSRALRFRARYAVDEVRDIRWEDGEMVFRFTDPDRRLGTSLRVEDRPVSQAFRQEDVEAFGRAFRELRARRVD